MKYPKTTTVTKLSFLVALLVALYFDLRWWSLLVAFVAAFVLGQLYFKLSLPARIRSGQQASETAKYEREQRIDHADWVDPPKDDPKGPV